MKHLFVSISVKQNLFVSVFVHKCLMMLNDVEYTRFKMFVTQMNNYLFVISFQLMFYKTLRYRLARPLTVTRLRYNFILVSRLISEKAYYVKDNVVLQGLCPSSIVYTRNILKSTMLRPLKGEVGYKLSASKWSKIPAQAPLAFNCQIDLMFFFKVYRFLHPSIANNVIACRCSSVIYPHLPLS